VQNAEISVIEDFYNILDRSIEKSIFPLLPEHTEFMAYSPLYRGGLTDTSIAEILKKGESALDMLFRHQGLKEFMRERKLYELVAAKR
jgi:aryl-alcohol dehydrogenase-like predicted oxidoreductase